MSNARFLDILGPDGLLSGSLSNYEFRPAQLEMAEVVADTMKGQRASLIEAGTGTGKTIAYLLPLVELGIRSVISTGTKNLQDQLIKKDIPILEKCLGRGIRAYCLKGRANYICLRRWKQFFVRPGFNFRGTSEEVLKIKDWIVNTKTGEKSELDWLSEDHPLWPEICSTTETCRGPKCEDYERCFVNNARQEAAGADLVVVNHHLLLADCCLRARSNVKAIPGYSRLVVDEAHMLEQVATEYFGLMISSRRIQELIGDIRREISSEKIEDEELNIILDRLLKGSFAFFESIPVYEERFSITDKIFTRTVKDSIHALTVVLFTLSARLEALSAKHDSLSGCRRRTQEMHASLDFIADHEDPDYVFWGEKKGNAIYLKVSPIDVSKDISTNLFKPLKGIVMTSATLSTDGGFEYIVSRLGLDADIKLILESHFDHETQAVIFIPEGMPAPSHDGFADQIGPQISNILELTKGRALVLFTSYRNLEIAYRYLKERGCKYRILKQGEGAKEYLLKEFCRDISSVLLATASFWQGVDVPGEALSCVIIDRLPFSVPTDPITEARIKWIRERGGNPFREYQLPSAIISLKQGFGRLIRHRNDRGLLVILDPRIRTKSYGKTILNNLPKCPVLNSLDEIKGNMDIFQGGDDN